MIEAKELRIGNLVYLKYKNYPNPIAHPIEAFEIVAIADKKISKIGIEILPIPITETLLSNNGFRNLVDANSKVEYWQRGFNVNGISCPPITIWNGKTDVGRSSIGQHIEHVHQLQNLYFSLTGKELYIKL